MLAAAAAVLTAVSALYYSHYRDSLRADAEQLLLSTGQIKLDQLLNWRRERLSDAMLLAESPVFTSYASRLGPGTPRGEAASLARTRLESYLKYKRYPFGALADRNGRVLAYAGEKPEAICPQFKNLVPAAMAAGRPQMGDFYLSDEDLSPHIDIVAPVGGDSGLLLLLRVNPADYLYPLLQSWSAKRNTGEILLVARDGDDVLFLNDIRHVRDAAMRLRLPVNDPDLPAAVGLRGYHGVVVGRDYRGAKVLASVSPVEGTNWALVTKMDWTEVMEGSIAVGVLLALLLLAMVGGAGTAAFLLVRQQAEEGWKMLARLTEQVPGVVYQYRLYPDGRSCFPYSSSGMRQIYEVTSEEVREDATPVFGRLHPDDLKATSEAIFESARNLSIFHWEFRVVLPEQGLRWRLCDARPERMPDGGTLWYGIITDITERKKAEDEVLALARQRQLALDAARLGWWRYVPDTGISYYDERYKEIFGVAGSERPNDEILKRLHPEDLPGVWARVKEALDPGKRTPYFAEYRIIMPDGGVKWVEAYGQAIFDAPEAGAHALELVGTVADITGRRQMEQALARSEEQFRSMFEMHSAVMLLISPETGRILDANLAAERFYGHARARLKEMLINDINVAPPEEISGALKGVNSGARTHFEANHRLADGGVRVVDVHASSVTTSSGHVNFAVIHDITDKRQAEQRIVKLNRDLRAKNQEMENFLYITTHDLRSPLVNIQGFSQNIGRYLKELRDALSGLQASQEEKAVIDKLAGEKMPAALDYVLSGSRKMDALITALLKVSRAGRVEMRPERLDAAAVLQKVADAMRFQLEQCGAELKAGALPACWADQGALSQVFSNLIDNAVKYRAEGRAPLIEVSGERAGDKVVYRVTDDGPGIPAGDLDRIWNVFYSHERADARKGEGIGLPMVKRLVEKNGGSIKAEAAPGRGVIFIIELPAGEGK